MQLNAAVTTVSTLKASQFSSFALSIDFKLLKASSIGSNMDYMVVNSKPIPLILPKFA